MTPRPPTHYLSKPRGGGSHTRTGPGRPLGVHHRQWSGMQTSGCITPRQNGGCCMGSLKLASVPRFMCEALAWTTYRHRGRESRGNGFYWGRSEQLGRRCHHMLPRMSQTKVQRIFVHHTHAFRAGKCILTPTQVQVKESPHMMGTTTTQ